MAHISRYASIASTLRLISFAIFFVQAHTGHKKNGNKVLLLLLDGMRWDLFGANMPALKKVEENGVRLDWLDPVFPTLSSPSMFSIATGLYPESHNIVHNKMFTNTSQVTWHWNEAFTDRQYAYWWDQPGVEPAWVTAMKQGLKAGSIAYPGGELPIHGYLPTNFVSNRLERTLKERIDVAMGYFEEDDFDLVFLYWINPDDTLHKHGLNSPEMYQKIQDIDEGVQYLFQQISASGLEDTLDVLITSDHGMTECDPRKLVYIYDVIDPQDVTFITGDGSLIQIEPVEGKLDKVIEDLQRNTPVLSVYKRDEMDERFHYGGSKRNLQIIGIADLGWGFTNDPNFSWNNGHHGYDNKLMDMKSILFAQGPSFKKGYRARNMESVNIYPLICEILNLTQSPNNGSREHYQDMLALVTPSSEETTPPTEAPAHPTQPVKMPTPPRECGGTPPETKLTVRMLSLVTMCLSLLSLLLGVTTIYYCGRYGLCKRGLFACCHDDEYRSHSGFISLANDIDLDDEDKI